MLTEEKLIPYHASDLTGKRALVFAPHPDDETIGCGGSLALHAGAGDPVKVVFLTNGAKGDVSGQEDKDAYIRLRRDEAQKACTCLGVTDLEFLSYEDRSLAGSRGALHQIMGLIEDFQPDLVYCPSPIEFHPDHRAACFLVCDALRDWESDLIVAFYEIGQPLCINTLVDISDVLPKKAEALRAYRSQIKERPYGDISLALNRYRSMTLEENATHAEGFAIWKGDVVRKVGPLSLPFQRIERLSPSRLEAGPLVSIIVRTTDRPALLAHALRSIAHQTYPHLEIVLVNDGGPDVADLANTLTRGIPLVYVRHEESRGRSSAANSGLKAAHGSYLNFLDDDDVLYPDHVETLLSHVQAEDRKVVYASVLNVYFHGLPEIPENRAKEEVIFDIPFDPERILFENYIPAMSVLFSREVLKWVDGFSEDLELFEDWDFWVRISRHTVFHHVNKVTAEYRFYGKADMEMAHRNKYDYDEALSVMFERNRPFIDGKAWVRFLNRGIAGTLRHELWEREARLEHMENPKKGLDWKERYDALLDQYQAVNAQYLETQRVLERIASHVGFKAYRKIKGFLKGPGDPNRGR